MNLYQFLLIVAARFKIVLLMLMVTVAAAVTASLLLPKTYKATAALVINYKGTDPVTGFSLPSQLMPGFMATQTDIIKSKNTAMKVVDELKLTESREAKKNFLKATEGKGDIREWQAAALLKYLDVAPARDSSVINITFRDSDPRVAAAIANAFADAYQQTSLQLKVDPSKKAAMFFSDQVRQLREKFDKRQQALSQYLQENGIVGSDNRVDAETGRLNDLAGQLTIAQAQTLEAVSRRSGAEGRGASESPDIFANPLIQNLKMQLTQAESKLSGTAERYMHDHPQYLQSEAEVNRLRAELNAQTAAASNSLASNARILRKRESDLQAAFDAQKVRVLVLNRKQDQVRILANERDNAQRAYETAAQRFTQANLEGQSNQTDIAVLNVADPPLVPASPRLLLTIVLSAFLGAALGIGFAVLAEMLDRRVRSAADLIKALQVPVLGVIGGNDSRQRLLGGPKILLGH